MKYLVPFLSLVFISQIIQCNNNQEITLKAGDVETLQLMLNEIARLNLPVNLNVRTEIKASIVTHEGDPNFKCCHLYGQNLAQCLNCLSKEDLKKNFAYLNVNAARHYLMQLTADELKMFLNAFTEEDWQNYWYNLTPEDQQIMPKTLQEQLDVVKHLEDSIKEAVAQRKQHELYKLQNEYVYLKKRLYNFGMVIPKPQS